MNFIFLFFKICVYLFVAVLGLHCCAGFPLDAVSRSRSLVAVPGLLIAMASLLVAPGLWSTGSIVVACELSNCGSQALEYRLSSYSTWA